MVEFTCNICGASNQCAKEQLTREASTCTACGSNVRTRSLMWLLSMELFGTALVLPDFPRIKSLRGIGMTDWNEYARRLGEKFDYRNTFYNREPKFDITNPPPEEFGRYDFLISSEIFEHVLPPRERAFENAHRLLKPNGVLILTVPYSLEASMLEHYPEIHEFGFAQVGGAMVLVNRTRIRRAAGVRKAGVPRAGRRKSSGDARVYRSRRETDARRRGFRRRADLRGKLSGRTASFIPRSGRCRWSRAKASSRFQWIRRAR